MVAQRKSRKTSSRAKVFFDQLRELGDPEAVVAKLNEMSQDELLPLILESMVEEGPDHRRRILVDLANLHDDGIKWFWNRYGPPYKAFLSDAEVLALRNEVRFIWDRDDKLDVEKQKIIDSWLSHKPHWWPSRYHNSSPLWVVWRYRKVLPNPVSLRAIIALAIVENAAQLSICRNPNCPVPYFLAKRKGQKYCERDDCTAYAQRQYALKWWEKEGRKRRAKKQQKRLRAKEKGRSLSKRKRQKRS